MIGVHPLLSVSFIRPSPWLMARLFAASVAASSREKRRTSYRQTMANRDDRMREYDRRRRGDATSTDNDGPRVPFELTKQLLQLHNPGQRVSNGAVELT